MTTRAVPKRILGSRIAAISDGRAWPWLLLLPSLLLVFAVIVYPTLSGIDLSFRQMRLNRPDLGTGYVGLRHYLALFDDPVFWVSLRNTFVWVVATVALEFALGMLAALVLDMDLPGPGCLHRGNERGVILRVDGVLDDVLGRIHLSSTNHHGVFGESRRRKRRKPESENRSGGKKRVAKYHVAFSCCEP